MPSSAASRAIDVLEQANGLRGTRVDTRERINVVIMYMEQDQEESDGQCASVEAGSALQTLADVIRYEGNSAILAKLHKACEIIDEARAECRANGTLMERARSHTRYLHQ